MTNDSDYFERESFARYIAKDLVSKFSGEGIETIAGGKPSSDTFFIGTLLSKPSKPKGWQKRAAPTEVGIEVLLPLNTAPNSKIHVKMAGSFWYRVLPTFAEQTFNLSTTLTSESSDEDDEIGIDDVDDGNEDNGQVRIQVPSLETQIKQLWRKTGQKSVTFAIPIESIPMSGEIELTEVGRIAKEALGVWQADQRKFRPMKTSGQSQSQMADNLVLPNGTLIDEESFETFVNNNFKGKPKSPQWETKGRLKSSIRGDGLRRVALILENPVVETSVPPDYIDNSVFESEVVVKADGFEFAELIVERLRDNYRYKGDVPGAGINCFAEEGSLGPKIEVRTSHAPILELKRLKATNFDASIEDLSNDPIPQLRKIKAEMEAYDKIFSDKLEDVRPSLSGEGLDLFEADVKLFKKELFRFTEGLRVLEEIPSALEAFMLTNKTFSMSSKGFRNWRRFQIIFLMCVIPDIVSPRFPQFKNCRDEVDVIYFPTGGGKTEAYLSAVVFQIFFDRLNGKKTGVSAITRFPLRLLSLQQIQRIADVFGAAEKIRRDHNIIGLKEFDRFSTGYFVGEGNTPNWLYKPGYNGGKATDEISPLIKNPKEGEKYLIIEKCPFCGKKTVNVIGNENDVRIRLVCAQCGELPVYLSDDEIYRYLPTFVIGTLDKMTSAGWRTHFKHLFGQVTHKCPDHGYLSGGRCLYSGAGNRCKRDPSEYMQVKLDDPTPSLIIQDEMHLIRESLGCYDSHYETFLEHLEESLTDGKKGLKIIAATATISSPERQLRHLYMRKGSYFPSRGNDRKESFYYEEDEGRVARFIVGVLPHNRTMVYAIQELIYQQQLMSRLLESDPEQLVKAGIFSTPQLAIDALRDYSVALSYNLMKMQGDAIGSAARRVLNQRFRDRGLREIEVQSMTGDVNFQQVKSVLGILEDRSDTRRIDLITATNMISHGVDIDTLNFMIFQGMPSSTAEYIQAYSRVGRRYPGIAIVVFNHMRERDLGHYKYFKNYHNLSDLLVEPVPINRWAKFSIERTLPGIFCATIMNYFDVVVARDGSIKGGLNMTKPFALALNNRIIDEDQIRDFILKSYGVDDDEMGQYFKGIITERVRGYVAGLMTPASNTFIANALPKGTQPLTSLRDTDTQIDITATRESYDPMANVSASRSGVNE
jgi:hypothetical protein